MGSFTLNNGRKIIMSLNKSFKIAFLFPGQGAQYPGMAKDFYEQFPQAKQIFEEADDVLKRNLSSIILEGPESVLTETKNSQTGIYVASMAILSVLKRLFPEMQASFFAGLSLGEYSALTASEHLDFDQTLQLVQYRGQYMNDACEATKGSMAVILGLDAEEVEQLVKEVNLPQDLWAANFNCPGQVVISGTLKGIDAGSAAAKIKGAKRVLPLQVYGAFHSGLMQQAEDRLAGHVLQTPIKESSFNLVMNLTANVVKDVNQIKENLIKQVTHPVRWEQSIRYMIGQKVDLFIEIGCGKTLAGFNKRIGVLGPTISIEKTNDLEILEKTLNERFIER